MDELLVDLSNLCSHNFAHHVIESVLENGSERHKASVAEELIGDAWRRGDRIGPNWTGGLHRGRMNKSGRPLPKKVVLEGSDWVS